MISYSGKWKAERLRQVSKLAAWSFALSLILLVPIGLLVAAFLSPSEGPNWEGLGWIIGMYLAVWKLFIASWIVGPISILLAWAALAKLRREPWRTASRALAIISIIISAAAIFMSSGIVVCARAKISAATPRRTPEVRATESQIAGERSELSVLETICDEYAAAHNDRYPPDAEAISAWMALKNMTSLQPALRNFDDYGAGIRLNVAPTPFEAWVRSRLIIFIARNKLPDGTRSVLTSGYAHTNHVLNYPDTEMTKVVDDYNGTRLSLRLSPIHWGDAAAPTTAPTMPAE